MCNLNSNGDTTIKHLNLGYDHMDSPLPKIWKIRKRFIYHDSNMSSCSSCEKKKKLTLAAKTETQLFSNRVHLRMVKL